MAYTDGLCDTRNAAGEEFGWPRFLDTVVDSANQKPRDVVETVMQAAEDFAEGAAQEDDVTLWAARVQNVMADEPAWMREAVAEPVAA